jgi:hypothetical protein
VVLLQHMPEKGRVARHDKFAEEPDFERIATFVEALP